MADKSTIARPYAKALFALALEHKKLGPWAQTLALSAEIVSDERMRKLLASPLLAPAQIADTLLEILDAAAPGGLEAAAAGGPDNQGRNFIRTLAANRRLGLLPEIAAHFGKLKADWENTADVTVVSAVPLDETLQRRYAQAMEKRLRRQVRLHCQVDPSVLGGAVLRADDLVIDGSLRGRLERLAAEVGQ